jgi:GT2 family glycosyltransferase
MKNKIINYALENDFDYLFLVDTDLVFHPDTILQLIRSEKSIISNIFRTSWVPNTMQMPQVWVEDEYFDV